MLQPLDVIGSIPSNLRTQTGCHVPLMKFPYFIGPAYRRGFEGPVTPRERNSCESAIKAPDTPETRDVGTPFGVRAES